MVEAEEEYVEKLEVWGNILLKELCVLDRKYVEKMRNSEILVLQ